MKYLAFIFLFSISFFVYSDIQTEIGKKIESDKEIIQLFEEYKTHLINPEVIKKTITYSDSRKPYLELQLEVNWNQEFINQLKVILKSISFKSDSCNSLTKHIVDKFSDRPSFKMLNLFQDMCGSEADIRIFNNPMNDFLTDIHFYFLKDNYQFGLIYDYLKVQMNEQSVFLNIHSQNFNTCQVISIKEMLSSRNGIVKSIEIDNKEKIYGQFDIFNLRKEDTILSIPVDSSFDINNHMEIKTDVTC
jgi:hypothetical protein